MYIFICRFQLLMSIYCQSNPWIWTINFPDSLISPALLISNAMYQNVHMSLNSPYWVNPASPYLGWFLWRPLMVGRKTIVSRFVCYIKNIPYHYRCTIWWEYALEQPYKPLQGVQITTKAESSSNNQSVIQDTSTHRNSRKRLQQNSQFWRREERSGDQVQYSG